MGKLYLLADAAGIVERRQALPPTTYMELWQDLYHPGTVWVGEMGKRLLEDLGGDLKVIMVLNEVAIPVYYGPGLRDVGSLPMEESVRLRVAAGHGIAVAWITYGGQGQRRRHDPSSPLDPIFYLRRPSTNEAHLWCLFRAKGEALTFMAEHFAEDLEAQEWAADLSVEDFDGLVQRYGARD